MAIHEDEQDTTRIDGRAESLAELALNRPMAPPTIRLAKTMIQITEDDVEVGR